MDFKTLLPTCVFEVYSVHQYITSVWWFCPQIYFGNHTCTCWLCGYCVVFGVSVSLALLVKWYNVFLVKYCHWCKLYFICSYIHWDHRTIKIYHYAYMEQHYKFWLCWYQNDVSGFFCQIFCCISYDMVYIYI